MSGVYGQHYSTVAFTHSCPSTCANLIANLELMLVCMLQSSSAKHQRLISCYYFWIYQTVAVCTVPPYDFLYLFFLDFHLSSLALSLPSSSGKLAVEYMRGQPLCMELFPQLFSSCRIPGPKHDHVVHYGRPRRGPAHITVVRNYQVTYIL